MRKSKWTKEKIIEFIENNEYVFIRFIKYDGVNSIIEVKCKEGHISSKKFSTFKLKPSCPECYNNRRSETFRESFDIVKEKIESIGYKLISKEYINNRTPLKIICDNNHKIEMTYDSIQQGKKCRICSGSNKHTIEEVKNEVRKEGYEILSNNYIDNKHYLTIMCPKFHIFKIRYDHWVNGVRCPKCRESKGEKKIQEVLISNNIIFKQQYTFNNCKNIKYLPFDFYLPQYNCCIEYDGEQHFKPIEFYGGEDEYLKCKERDNIKTQYCKDKNIKLIRIPYWEFNNIENILKQKLNLI